MLTTLWLQKDLNFLGYNAGPEDNDYGPKTREAVKRFQEDFRLAVDGIAGPDTCGRLERVIKECQSILGTAQDGLAGTDTKNSYNNFDGIQYFKYEEFTCHCGCGYNTIDIRLVKILDDIRKRYGKPAIITSGVRCEKHNREVGGVNGSWHTKRKAADFYINGISSSELMKYCSALVNQGILRYAYAIDSGAVHIDIGGKF